PGPPSGQVTPRTANQRGGRSEGPRRVRAPGVDRTRGSNAAGQLHRGDRWQLDLSRPDRGDGETFQPQLPDDLVLYLHQDNRRRDQHELRTRTTSTDEQTG